MRDRGSISDSTKKQTLGKYASPFADLLQTCAVAQGWQADAGFTAVSCAAAKCMAGGAFPDRMALQITLPAEAETETLAGLVRSAGEACEHYGLPAPAWSVLSLEGSFLPAVTAFASAAAPGQGRAAQKAKAGDHGEIVPGRSILMTGYAGWWGCAVLEEICRQQLAARFSPDYLRPVQTAGREAFSPVPAVRAGLAAGADQIHVCGEGGVFTGVWNLAKRLDLGARIELAQIPIRQETVEICDLMGVNPYQLMSQGCVLMTAPDPEQVLLQLAGAGIPACRIGSFTAGRDRVVISGEETRYLEPFRRDSFYDKDENNS